jgi:hypothetical protein
MAPRIYCWLPLFVFALVASSQPSYAQLPTGTISGRVVADGIGAAGVSITAVSPALQGEIATSSSATGDYLLLHLPPGNYTISFSDEGYRILEQRVKVSAAQTIFLDAEMVPTTVTGEITVTDSYETVSATTAAATTFEAPIIDKLPMPRTYDATVLLAPGTNTGMGGYITISGSLASENLFLINGVTAMDNYRGYVLPFYIEDAIDETTIQSSAISAEYGRFAGGVVNMVTKAGSNEFHGSYRLSLTNDAWVSETPISPERDNEIGGRHELTFGGPLWRDRVWFFLAGRFDPGNDESAQTVLTNIPYTTSYSEQRWEAKLTVSPHRGHRVTLSYLDWHDEAINTETNFGALDLDSLDDWSGHDGSLAALHYTGVLADRFFIEGQYSEKRYEPYSAGREGFSGDRIAGTQWVDFSSGSPLFGNMAAWDGDRYTDERNNTDLLLKGSVFFSGKRAGAHELVFGFDRFDDIREANAYQTPSDFQAVSPFPGIVDGQVYFPVVNPPFAFVSWIPIDQASLGTSFTTDSLFVNDTWRVNRRLTLNLGLRYDKNDGQNSDGDTVADDDRLSPRIGATFDLRGDGRFLLHGSIGRYVTALSNPVADGTAAGGNPSQYFYVYLGEPFNVDGPPYLSTPEVIEQMMDWFDAQGGTGATHLLYGSPVIAGLTRGIPNGLKSPYTDELTVGLTIRFGSKGGLRTDFVHREAHDFYVQKVDTTTGQVTDDLGNAFDYGEYINDDSLLERTYDGLHTQIDYRPFDRLTLGGTWTWSRLRGNWEGENIAGGPFPPSNVRAYPEYKDPSWNAPGGDLFGDQRHKLRAWVLWDAVATPRHLLNVSGLLNFSTGTPYYAATGIDVSAYVENPGYANPATFQNYFFSPRDAYRTDDITSFDVALFYSFTFPALGADFSLFIQPEVRNLFNSNGAVRHDSTVVVNPAMPFNPWTEVPVEGVHYTLGDNFGEPVTESDYQRPREFLVSLGLRF